MCVNFILSSTFHRRKTSNPAKNLVTYVAGADIPLERAGHQQNPS